MQLNALHNKTRTNFSPIWSIGSLLLVWKIGPHSGKMCNTASLRCETISNHSMQADNQFIYRTFVVRLVKLLSLRRHSRWPNFREVALFVWSKNFGRRIERRYQYFRLVHCVFCRTHQKIHFHRFITFADSYKCMMKIEPNILFFLKSHIMTILSLLLYIIGFLHLAMMISRFLINDAFTSVKIFYEKIIRHIALQIAY